MKKSTFITLGLAAMLVAAISSCQQPAEKKAESAEIKVSPDSLMNDWNSAWNKHDSAYLANLFTDQSVVVFSSEEKLTGTDSIMQNWINKNLPRMSNLRTEKVSSSTPSSEMVFYNGTYTLDVTRNDSIIGKDAGCFTLIWKNNSDKQWKLELAFFGVPPEN